MDDAKELILELVAYAKAGEHIKIEQLRFFSEYIAGRITYRATNKVVAMLEYSADDLFKKYCKAIRQHQADVNLLLAYKQLQYTVDFYKEELNIINDALVDYENYLWGGNFLKAFLFGEERDTWNTH
jgi:hypothetical protein